MNAITYDLISKNLNSSLVLTDNKLKAMKGCCSGSIIGNTIAVLSYLCFHAL